MPESRDYRLSVTTGTYKTLQDMASEEGITMAEILRRAIRLFLILQELKTKPGARFLIEEDGEQRELVIY